MEITLFWGEIMGWYMVILGVMIITRAKYLKQLMHDLVNDRANGMIIGMVMAFIGLFIVTTHNTWNGALEVIVSLLGWAFLVKGALYMWMPSTLLKAWINWFKIGSWMVIAGLFDIALGIYILTQANVL